jgi:hypothetical protein
MTKLEELLKQAQSLTLAISHDEALTTENKRIALELNEELNELISWFDPSWASYEQGYEYDPELIEIALRMGVTE